jgi:hypothetical protein
MFMQAHQPACNALKGALRAATQDTGGNMTGRRRSGAAAQAIARDAGHVAGAGEFPQSWHDREVRERIETVAASRRRAEADGHVSNWAEVNWTSVAT